MSASLPQKPVLSAPPEFLERGLLRLAVLLTAFAFFMPHALLLHRLSLEILAQFHAASSAP